MEPENQNVITIMSRLFPGQSINEILQSHEGMQALKFLNSNIKKSATPGQKLESLEVTNYKISKEGDDGDKLKHNDGIGKLSI